MRRPSSGHRSSRRARTVATLALAALAAPAIALGQVYRCVDPQGRTTYQQTPCTGGQQGRAIVIQPDNGSTRGPETTAQWQAAAAQKRVQNGMPKPWVLQALGAPTESRPARGGENATEIWTYAGVEETLQVGFIADAVAWWRRAPIEPATPADADRMRRATARTGIAAGRDCAELLSALGPPDREESANEADPTSTLAPLPFRGAMRYLYEPALGDPRYRTMFTCADNRVVDVERTQVR